MEILQIITYLCSLILIITILIIYSRVVLEKNLQKDPRKNKIELTKKIENKQRIIYTLSIISGVLFSISILLEEDNDWIVNFFIYLIIIILLVSVIAKVIKRKKLSNILCTIMIVPIICCHCVIPLYLIKEICFPERNSWFQDYFEKVTAFNVKFTQYDGIKTGEQVKTLIQEIISNNSNPGNKNRLIYVDFQKRNGVADTNIGLEKTKLVGESNIKVNAKYYVSFEIGDGTEKNVRKSSDAKLEEVKTESEIVYNCIIKPYN